VKLVTFTIAAGREARAPAPGALIEGGTKVAALPGFSSVLEIVEGGQNALDRAHEALKHSPVVLGRQNVTLLAPIPHPPQMRDFLCFEKHLLQAFRAIGKNPPPTWYERPVFPALFCTDITVNHLDNSGDWQINGIGHAVPPDFVSGTWKSATKSAAGVITVDGDPTKNNLILGPGSEYPHGGLTGFKNEGYNSEVRWNLSTLHCFDPGERPRPVAGLFVNCGWGTGGFKATPGSAHVFAHTIAKGEPHPLNAPFLLDRFRNGDLINEMAAAAVAH